MSENANDLAPIPPNRPNQFERLIFIVAAVAGVLQALKSFGWL
jgi:hypothetical protein